MFQLRVEKAVPAFGGVEFGDVGPYEYVTGRAVGSIDSRAWPDSSLRNLDRVEPDVNGLIRYEADVSVLRPAGPGRGNGWLIFEPVNRGGKRALQRFNRARVSSDFQTAADAGNGYLMAEGHTLAWCAWQADVAHKEGLMYATLPVARGVQGWCTQEFLEETGHDTFVVALTYPVADSALCRLTARTRERDPRDVPTGLTWNLVDDSHLEVTWRSERSRGTLFEFTYMAKDPVVGGAAYSLIRDIASYLRSEPVDESGNANPVLDGGRVVQHTLGLGVSLSARLLREFLHRGFNQARGKDRVFDYVMPVIAGARKVSVDLPFSHPNKFSGQHEGHSVPVYQPPFHYGSYVDRHGHAVPGILEDIESPPVVVHVDSDAEYWQGGASLVVADSDGVDRPEHPSVRIYLAGGIPHGGSVREARERVDGELNLMGYDWLARALLRAVRRHAEDGQELPASRHPTAADGTLVAPSDLRFPLIPELRYDGAHASVVVLDANVAPPGVLREYQVRVPAVDADGNTLGAILHPITRAAIGTFTGWIPRSEAYGGPDLSPGSGAMIAFARTRAERLANADPRASLEERYPTASTFTDAISQATEEMVRIGYLLPEDAADILDACERLGPGPDLMTYLAGNAVAAPLPWGSTPADRRTTTGTTDTSEVAAGGSQQPVRRGGGGPEEVRGLASGELEHVAQVERGALLRRKAAYDSDEG